MAACLCMGLVKCHLKLTGSPKSLNLSPASLSFGSGPSGPNPFEAMRVLPSWGLASLVIARQGQVILGFLSHTDRHSESLVDQEERRSTNAQDRYSTYTPGSGGDQRGACAEEGCSTAGNPRLLAGHPNLTVLTYRESGEQLSQPLTDDPEA